MNKQFSQRLSISHCDYNIDELKLCFEDLEEGNPLKEIRHIEVVE